MSFQGDCPPFKPGIAYLAMDVFDYDKKRKFVQIVDTSH